MSPIYKGVIAPYYQEHMKLRSFVWPLYTPPLLPSSSSPPHPPDLHSLLTDSGTEKPTSLYTDNRLVCDCSSRWLYHYIRQRSTLRSIDTTILCAGPPRLKTRDLTNLTEQDFDCESLSVKSLQVHAGPSCDNHVVSRGGRLRLLCTSTPNSHIVWSRVDQRSMSTATHSCRSFSSCVPEGGGNQLVMENMSEEYVGTYICTASLMNITTAVACRVTLGEPPTVISPPDDQYLAYPGETAFFRVRVSGQPHPSVEWYHDTLTGSTVQVKEDKRHIITASGSLVVMDTKLEDQGTYRAIFSNGAGTVTVTSSLEFLFYRSARMEGRATEFTTATVKLTMSADTAKSILV